MFNIENKKVRIAFFFFLIKECVAERYLQLLKSKLIF